MTRTSAALPFLCTQSCRHTFEVLTFCSHTSFARCLLCPVIAVTLDPPSPWTRSTRHRSRCSRSWKNTPEPERRGSSSRELHERAQERSVFFASSQGDSQLVRQASASRVKAQDKNAALGERRVDVFGAQGGYGLPFKNTFIGKSSWKEIE